MSYYDAEMVKKFATLNKELIEKTAKDHPEIGNLIKQIIESITEESTTTPTRGVPEEVEVMWNPIPQAEGLKDLYKDKTITEQLEAVGRFMGSKKSSNLTLKEISDMVISMLLMGNFYQLSNDQEKREKFNNLYNQNLEDYETAILYKPITQLNEILGKQVNTVGKDFVFDEKIIQNIASYLSIRAGLSDEELQVLSDALTNEAIFNFLKNLGKDGFWYEDERAWFIPKVVAGVGVILNDEFGNRLEFDPDFLRVELGINLFPAPQPEFSMGDKVVLERTQNRQGEVGTIIERTRSTNFYKYIYSVQLEKATITNSTMTYNQTVTITAEESELEKANSTSTSQTTKPTLPTPSTPEEIEISQMSKEQLKELKEELEETLTYLEDDDPEKNDLLGQIKFLNLYLEN